jgi:hypothetical protein
VSGRRDSALCAGFAARPPNSRNRRRFADDGRLFHWASPTQEAVREVVNNPNQIVRVVVRHVPVHHEER